MGGRFDVPFSPYLRGVRRTYRCRDCILCRTLSPDGQSRRLRHPGMDRMHRREAYLRQLLQCDGPPPPSSLHHAPSSPLKNQSLLHLCNTPHIILLCLLIGVATFLWKRKIAVHLWLMIYVECGKKLGKQSLSRMVILFLTTNKYCINHS